MKNKSNPYKHFDKFVLRSPVLDQELYYTITAKENIDDDLMLSLFEMPIVREAIFLASPILYFELEKWGNNCLDSDKVEKVKISFLKYLSRMTSRCTPFGLFAGCSIGEIKEETNIKLAERSKFIRYTRPDMDFMVAISQDLSKDSKIQNQLNYYPNSSLYNIGKNLRYIEYHYRNGKRKHQMVEVDNSHTLSKILEHAKNGATIEELSKGVINDNISLNDATNFVYELINSQVLISELEPSVSGKQFIEQIIEVLKSKSDCNPEIAFFEKLRAKFFSLDRKLGNPPNEYIDISKEIKKRFDKFELKFLFQTDLELATSSCQISFELIEQVKEVLVLFNKITPTPKESNLSAFKKKFIARYEGRQVPLSKVLDVESGIGYIQDSDAGDINPLIDDIILPHNKNELNEYNHLWNDVYQVINDKIINASKKNRTKIEIHPNDFNHLTTNWDNLPDTISTIGQIIQFDNQIKIKVSAFGGSSAANLLGRFSHEGSSLKDFTCHITEMEKKMNPDKILAEIVHLPESRAGNILMRPNLRDYEIPYLAKSNMPTNFQLDINDLLVSVKNNRIMLTSKKLQKEILPHLTNAHNFSYNSLPVYHFLCDLQTQDLRNWIGFSYGPLTHHHKFLPRVEFKNIIISEARWNLKKLDIEPLINVMVESSKLMKQIEMFLKKNNLPDLVLLEESDNELLINFKNIDSVKMFLKTVAKKGSFILKEHLFNKHNTQATNTVNCINQVILAFFNGNKTSKN